MRMVIVESPFAGDVEANQKYARACMADCLKRGEAPFASHLLYTQPGVLDDTKPEERAKGIAAGFEWRAAADLTVVYVDRGMSGGMREGIAHAKNTGCPVEYRSLSQPGLQAGRITELQCSGRILLGDDDDDAPPTQKDGSK